MYPRAAASLGLAFLGSLFGLEAQAQSDRPNFVFIITDDQDFHMGTLPHMTAVTEKLINEGTLFEKHFCTSEFPARDRDRETETETDRDEWNVSQCFTNPFSACRNVSQKKKYLD